MPDQKLKPTITRGPTSPGLLKKLFTSWNKKIAKCFVQFFANNCCSFFCEGPRLKLTFVLGFFVGTSNAFPADAVACSARYDWCTGSFSYKAQLIHQLTLGQFKVIETLWAFLNNPAMMDTSELCSATLGWETDGRYLGNTWCCWQKLGYRCCFECAVTVLVPA